MADCSVALVAELAMQLSGQHLPDYGAMRSRHDFTQRQLISCLVLRAYLNTTYRGILKLLGAMPDARDRMGLNAKLPHFTTLQKFGARRRITDIARLMVRTIGTATESGDAEPAPAPNGPERDKKRTRPVED